MTSVGEATDAATVMSARRADIVQGWLGLPLFATAFAGQRDDAEAAAGMLLDALIEVAGSGRTDDFRAPTFKMISDVLSRVTSSRLRSGGDLSQIVAEIGELREPVKAVFDDAPDAAMVPSALVTASELVGALRVAAIVALLNESDDAVARQRQELLETTTPSITTRATLSGALKYGLEQTGVRLGTGG